MHILHLHIQTLTHTHTYKRYTLIHTHTHTCTHYSYTCPGQLVALRLPGKSEISQRLYSIASTPYESRSESSGLAASLIEVNTEL
jgi:ferredoxin-NADP reductase